MSPTQKTIAGFLGVVVSVVTGIISREIRFHPGEFISFIGSLLFIVGLYKTIFATPKGPATRAPAELQALEHRMTDVQEIVISLDERLKRLEGTKEPTLEESRG